MEISPIDSALYMGLIDSIDTFPTKGSLNSTVPAAYTQAQDFETSVDLSNYYSDPETTNMYAQVSNNVINSAKALDNAMVQALESGFDVKDAVSMNLALRAYQANCMVAKSTFELKI